MGVFLGLLRKFLALDFCGFCEFFVDFYGFFGRRLFYNLINFLLKSGFKFGGFCKNC